MKKKEEKKKKGWWYWVLIIIALVIILSSLGKSDCVDDCVGSNYDCIAYTTAYSRYSLADMCSSELEDCVSGCRG